MRLQGGKHTGQSLMATDGCPNVPGRLFVTDRCTKMQFLVDTGSELCVFHARPCNSDVDYLSIECCKRNNYKYLRLRQPGVKLIITSSLSVAICRG
ncbi:hypothetical protein EVAR_86204_1 [Eumeta japonica]|uniref:Peptidase A2 domain-containing protein n=1 Tax=Eumeta variegata TaxID=151549 RepID=A0A4C1UBW4_EUMVA|nr:hypothetical protein EVAR_86204_1 [Eumeta japonica]